MAKAKETGLVVATEEMPAYLVEKQLEQGDDTRGSENVGQDDITIPRLEIVQDTSPIRKKNDPAYVEGAEAGMLYNSVTRELYGESVQVVFVTFKKEYLVWKDRDQGGGFGGAFLTLDEANDRIVEATNEGDQGPWEATDTAQHFALLIHPDGKVDEVAISMAKSKMKISKKLNSMIRMFGGDRFSRVYNISSAYEQGKKGDFYNFHIVQAGYPSQDLYTKAEAVYEDIASGAKEINVAQDDAPTPEAGAKGEQPSNF